MTGHLFLARGDLLQLHCDAILIPSGIGVDDTGQKRFGRLEDPWAKAVSKSAGEYLDDPPDDQRRICMVRPSKQPSTDDWSPEVWAAHTGETGQSGQWHAQPLREFVQEFDGRVGPLALRPLSDERPLLGVPLLGAQRSAKADAKGEVVKAVVGALSDELKTANVDVVLVLFTSASYSAAQEARTRYQESAKTDSWPELDQKLWDRAVELAREAEAGRLVLFMGAGVSMGAGLPSWGDLLTELADRAKLSSDERKQLERLDPRDAGAVLEKRLGKAALRESIEQLLGRTHVSLVHQLLASLPVTEALTTNYDVLFETAWRATGRTPAVLPIEPRSKADHWLVKLHGSASDPDRDVKTGTLVLSRDDYLNFETSSPALAGIVQAMLLTKHLLFVGYSLKDENFHRMAHQVRATVAANRGLDDESMPFGTVLTDQAISLVNDLWERDLEFISTWGKDKSGSIRRVAIFLDLLAASTATRADHLMLKTFEGVFTDDELALRSQLEAVREAATKDNVRPGIRNAVEDALSRFGTTSTPVPTSRHRFD